MKIKEINIDMNRIFSVNRFLSILLLIFVFTLQNSNAAEVNQSKIMVNGLVRDAHTKKPINAAQISLLNNKKTTTTNEKGYFKIEVNSKHALLHISAYNYNVREYALQGKDSLIIELYPDVFSNYYKKVDGVNGQLSNSTLINSIVGTNEINSSRAFTADELLQTELGGDVRTISRSAQIGQGVSAFIRGYNSLNTNAQPLYVVDGVIWNSMYEINSIHDGYSFNPFTNIDINDIESISVLKDGTSVYGSKGANGVILVKTKRGSEMATKINLNIVTGMTTVPATIPVMNASEYKIYATSLLKTTGLTNNEIAALPYLNDDPARSTYPLYHNNTNWANEVYKPAISKSYSINVKGGDEKALYYFSLGYSGNDGIVKSTNLERYSIRLNGDIQLFKNTTLGVNVGYVRIDRKVIDDGINYYSSPTWLCNIKSPFLNPTTYTFAGEKTTEFAFADVFNVGNPGGIIKYSNNTVKQNKFNVSLKPVYTISKSLTLSNTFDYSFDKINEDSYRPYLYSAPIQIEGIGYSYNNRANQVIKNNSIFNDLRLSYNTHIKDYTTLNLFIGTRYISNNFESDFIEGHNSMSNSSINLHGSFKNIYATGINNSTKSISNYFSLEANYDNRLMLNLSSSMDASSRFGNQVNGGISLFGVSWGLFPSFSGAWLLSSEEFMQSVKFIDLLKLKAGLGITGNDDIPNYQTMAYFSSIRFKGVGNGMIISQLANPKIQWENTARLNLGFDLNMFNDRLSLSTNVYSSNTDNLLVVKQFQDVAGLNSYWTNSGTLSNVGFEATVNAKLINLKKFQWELGISAGHYKNKIFNIPNDEFTTKLFGGEILTREGSPAGLFYGYKTQGVFSTEAQANESGLKIINNSGVEVPFGAGDVHFVDNGDKIIDSKDKQIIGDPNPTVYGTFTNKLSYRNLTLTALFTYSYGNDIYNYQRSQLESGKDFSNQSLAMLNRWTSEGQSTTQPIAVYGDPMGNSRFSDRWIEDGSYIRLKSLSLSYDLPLKSNFLEGINVWISANNLFTLTSYLGVDPESSAGNSVLYQGIDTGLLPFSKNYNVGLKFNL